MDEYKMQLIKICGIKLKQYWKGHIALSAYTRNEERLHKVIWLYTSKIRKGGAKQTQSKNKGNTKDKNRER